MDLVAFSGRYKMGSTTNLQVELVCLVVFMPLHITSWVHVS